MKIPNSRESKAKPAIPTRASSEVEEGTAHSRSWANPKGNWKKRRGFGQSFISRITPWRSVRQDRDLIAAAEAATVGAFAGAPLV